MNSQLLDDLKVEELTFEEKKSIDGGNFLTESEYNALLGIALKIFKAAVKLFAGFSI